VPILLDNDFLERNKMVAIGDRARSDLLEQLKLDVEVPLASTSSLFYIFRELIPGWCVVAGEVPYDGL